MSFQQILESERLVYKPIDSSYCTPEYLSWLNDEEVIRYLEIFEPYSEAQLRSYLEAAEKNDSLFFFGNSYKEY